jgi:hypothetical protein
MGFWRGLAVQLGTGMVSFLILALIVLVVSQVTNDSEQIMIYSFILVPIVSISIASIYYIFKS